MAVQCDSDGAGERCPKISIFDFRNCLLLLVLCFLPIVYCGEANISCTSVRSIFESKGMLSAADLQDIPNYDAGELCLNRGCCGSNARLKLTQHARTQLETSIRTELIKLSEVLSNRAKKFDEFFRKLLQQSREEFHAMFKRTYGMIYEQHSYVFEQLFEQLEQYYVKGDTDLDNMMDNFFGILYQKMFTVLNSQYTFDEKYLKCVSENMKDTQPFEDVPHKLSVQLRRAFVATRTFHKALRAGSDVVRNMLQVGITPECVTAWARLRFCGACGDAQPPACSRYCHNLLRGCLPAQADLAQQWDAYVDAVEKVADRLLGPFNIVMVVEPIDIKISEAIMNFQEHNHDISQKIFSHCGKPVLGGGAGPFLKMDRLKRSPRSILNFQNQKSNDDDFEIEASLESLIQEPTMYVSSKKEQVKDRAKFLQYWRDDIDAEEYEDHERRKREADPEPVGAVDSDYGSYDSFEGKRGKKGKKISTKVDSRKDNVLDWSGPALERLVRETRARVRNSRRYWANLPYLLCSEQSVAPAPNAACFNGSHVASYTLSAAGEGSAALASNPEVRGTVAGLGIVAAQQETLKSLSVKLKDAYNGVDVQWKDADDQDISPSSMEFDDSVGSGSGSGDGSDDLPEDDDDREPDYDGSGQAPPDDDDSTAGVEYDNVNENQTPKATEPPHTPYMGKTNIDISIDPDTKSSQYPDHDIPEMTEKIPEVDVDVPVKQPPKGSSAARPSLQQALIAYTLPVVFTCFGNMLLGLF